jgi:hypothetical protein
LLFFSFFFFPFLLYFCKENIFSAPCLRVALIVSEISISQASWHLHPLSTFSYNFTTNTTTFMLLNSLYKHKLKMLNRFVIFTMRLILMTSLWYWFENTSSSHTLFDLRSYLECWWFCVRFFSLSFFFQCEKF